jgi:O-antigen ligase
MKKRKHDNETVESSSMQKNKLHSDVVGISLIFFLLDKLSDVIYNALINGLFGRIFTAYSSELSAYDRGCLKFFFRNDSKTRFYFRKIREYLSKSFETSFLLGKLRKAVCGMADIPIRSYGRFFLSFGIYTLLVYIIKVLVPIVGTANTDYLFVGGAICIISSPLLFSRLSLAKAVKRSRITEAIFVDGFGYRDESFATRQTKGNAHSGRSILVGLVAGILTFFVHPLIILVAMLICVIFALIIITPEIGVLACLFGLPFFSFGNVPTFMISAMVTVTALSYIIKLVRGKRIIKIELVDLAVLTFLLMIYFSGIISVGDSGSAYSALITCILMVGYFLVVNLMRTEKWLHRCVVAIISSATIVAIIGIIQYVSGAAIDNWIDKSYFVDINGRVTSLFENPNFLAAYLAIVFPIAIYQAIVCKRTKSRVLCSVSCFMMVVCTILTWSRAAWIAMLVCGILFFMFVSRKTLRYILLCSIAVPFLPFVLPKNVVARFLSIGDMADSSTLYRVYTWRGSLSMIKDNLWGGIGYGAEAFTQMYPVYAYAGIESAVHSHSLYLQILIGMGIGGLVCFAVIILFYMQNSLEYIKSPSCRQSSLLVASCVCGIIAMLIMGLFDYVWYNYRIFFMFWAVMALGVACIRVGNKEISRNSIKDEADSYSATLDFEIVKRS